MTRGWGSEAQAGAAFLGSASAQACGGSTSPGARFLCCRGLDVTDPLASSMGSAQLRDTDRIRDGKGDPQAVRLDEMPADTSGSQHTTRAGTANALALQVTDELSYRPRSPCLVVTTW